MRSRIPILFAFIVASQACLGQDTVQPRYQSVFGDSSTLWYVYNYHWNAGVGTEVRQSLSNDTIIFDGITYKILRYVNNLSWGYSLYNEDQYMRESSNHSKLYFKGNTYLAEQRLQPEILVMDLDLNIGDTLDTQGWGELPIDDGGEYNIPTIRIDTIYYYNGRKILRTDYQKMHYYDIERLFFIEGVGPSFGPFYARNGDCMSLTCYYRDGENQYHGFMYNYDLDEHNTGDPCIKAWHGGYIRIPEGDSHAIIYPNPTRNVFTVTPTIPSTYKIKVASSTGIVVYKNEFTGERASVNLQDLPHGVYFVTITNDKENTTTKRIIKI